MGKERFDNALQLLGPPLAERTKERRPDRRGQLREQVVFRHSIANEKGAVPASVTRDPDVRAMLAELALIEAVAQAKAAGRRNPRAIARWIIADPFMSRRIADWIDIETPLAKESRGTRRIVVTPGVASPKAAGRKIRAFVRTPDPSCPGTPNERPRQAAGCTHAARVLRPQGRYSVPQRCMATRQNPHNRAHLSGTRWNGITPQGGLLTGGLLVRVQPGESGTPCKAAR